MTRVARPRDLRAAARAAALAVAAAATSAPAGGPSVGADPRSPVERYESGVPVVLDAVRCAPDLLACAPFPTAARAFFGMAECRAALARLGADVPGAARPDRPVVMARCRYQPGHARLPEIRATRAAPAERPDDPRPPADTFRSSGPAADMRRAAS